MRLAKKINITKKQLILLFLFFVGFFLTRLLGLKTDAINPDGVNWHYRSQQFVVGLKNKQFEKTYQHYHPGVTLMWITGIPIELYKQITGITIYDQFNFLNFHLVARLSLIFVQFVLTLLIIYFLSEIVGFKKSLLIVFLLSFEPYFVGNSRLYHMDVLFTLLVFLCLIVFYLYYKTEKIWFLIFGALLSAFVFLTRSVGIGIFLYGGLILFYKYYEKYKQDDFSAKCFFKNFSFYILLFIFCAIIFFPALWVRPLHYLVEIFSEAERVGIRKGHSQIFFKKNTIDPGVLFYPIVIALKFSPVILIGFIGYIKKVIKDPFGILMSVFYLGYFIVMTLPSKKLDRYMITLFPLFAYFAGNYLYNLLVKYTEKKFLVLLFYTAFLLIPLIKIFPYYFTYTSPLFINSRVANNIVGQKNFGIGIPKLKEMILEKYGQDVRMGFIDAKPMKAIYANSMVEDIRVSSHDDYDILVLGINEEGLEELFIQHPYFTLDTIYEINGLEYWRIYVKKTF